MTGPQSPGTFDGLDGGETLEARVRLALEEDVGPGDFTTLWTVPEGLRGEAVIVAKEELVVAGAPAALAVFRAMDAGLDVEVLHGDGSRVPAGSTVMELRGPVRPILTGERTALNFLGRLSGIATLTGAFVEAVRGTGARILDTRKTTPGWRQLEKEAVRAGGGVNHRFGLHDMVMVKDNHIAAAGGIREAVEGVRRSNERGLAVEVEVTTLAELETALGLDVDRILLDNMDPDTLRRAVARTRELGEPRPELEASGSVTLATVREVAETGVDYVSVGALTHSARAADLSLRMGRRE